MIPFTVISASYGNPDQTLIVAKTENRGTMLLTQSGMPDEWEHFHTLGIQVQNFEESPPLPEPVVVLYPVDLWSRLTDAEADAVESAMTAQSVRLQNIFRSAASYRSDHELWPLLETIATDLFGAARAAEILSAS